MIKYVVRKILYGILVLWGVVSVLFFLIHTDPTNAARNYAGKHTDEAAIKEVEKLYKLDLPVYEQYLLYLNDLSPISIYNPNVEDSHIYLDDNDYSYTELFAFSEDRSLVIKWPFLRRTYDTREKVSDLIREPLMETTILALVSIGMAILLGITLGVLAALYKGTFIDGASLVISTLGMSGPSFFMGVVILWIGSFLWYEMTYIPVLPFLFILVGAAIGAIFNKRVAKKRFVNFSWAFFGESIFKGFIFGWIAWIIGYSINALYGEGTIALINFDFEMGGTGLNPGTLHTTDDYGDEYVDYSKIILPAITLGIRPLAIIMQLTRSSMLDVLSQDYIRTATAKGLAHYRVVVKHALKNALNPVITAVSGWFASLLAGTVFVEQIFGWNGIGLLIYEAIIGKNMPLVIGSMLIIAAFFVIINIIVDIMYGMIDPRVRVQ